MRGRVTKRLSQQGTQAAPKSSQRRASVENVIIIYLTLVSVARAGLRVTLRQSYRWAVQHRPSQQSP